MKMRSFVFLVCLLALTEARNIDSPVLEAYRMQREEFPRDENPGPVVYFQGYPNVEVEALAEFMNETEETAIDSKNARYASYFFLDLATMDSTTVDPKVDPNACIYLTPGLPTCAFPEELESTEPEGKQTAEEGTSDLQTPEGRVYRVVRDAELNDISGVESPFTVSKFIRNESKVFYLKRCSPAKKYSIPFCKGKDPVREADEVYRLYPYAMESTPGSCINAKSGKWIPLWGPKKTDTIISEKPAKQSTPIIAAITSDDAGVANGNAFSILDGCPGVMYTSVPASETQNKLDLDNEESTKRILAQFIKDWQMVNTEQDTDDDNDYENIDINDLPKINISPSLQREIEIEKSSPPEIQRAPVVISEEELSKMHRMEEELERNYLKDLLKNVHLPHKAASPSCTCND